MIAMTLNLLHRGQHRHYAVLRGIIHNNIIKRSNVWTKCSGKSQFYPAKIVKVRRNVKNLIGGRRGKSWKTDRLDIYLKLKLWVDPQ